MNRLIQSSNGSKLAWHLVDAKGQIVGRLANQIASILMGKHKPTYCPNLSCGDVVVVINAREVELTGNKWQQKLYRWHTGWPGGLKQRTAKEQLDRKPEEVLWRAVYGMLPKNKLRKISIDKLKIYPGPAHLHQQQLKYAGKGVL